MGFSRASPRQKHARFSRLEGRTFELKGIYETSSTLGPMDPPSDPAGSNCPTTGNQHWALLSDVSEVINSGSFEEVTHSEVHPYRHGNLDIRALTL